ncbi:hypothetical protein [Streptococcus oricebi]|uniref:hypothetical protein n=1 Tax=Streptococcus oricebi TaxID=1547447 RepID=UPI001FD91415|nr:hypothetical protein [Streptococcus oricebi]
MAKYYTHEDDFKEGSKTGLFHSNIDCVKDLLKDIDEVAKKVNSEGIADLYVATGEATLGRDMPVSPFEDAEHHALKRLEAAKKIHKEIVQNIDGKFFEGLDNALDSLNKVNEGDHKYKSEHLTYEKTHTYNNYGYGPYSSGRPQTYTTTEHYSISDIVNSDKTPIPAAKELYDAKLKLAKEGLAKIEKEDHEKYEKLKGLNDHDLMEAMFPTQIGEYQRARSTWKENNKEWLQWVEIGGKIIAVGAIIAGSVLSGGTLAPLLIGGGTLLLVADSTYQAASGETISGKRLSDGERVWAGVDAVLTAATGGLATYASVLAKTGKTATTTVQTVTKAANYADDANDIIHTATAMKDDPLGAMAQFIGGRALAHGTSFVGNKVRARSGKGGGAADVDLPTSGKGGDLPSSARPDLKTSSATDVDLSALGSGKKVKPEIETPRTQEVSGPSKKPELDSSKTSKPEINRSSSPEVTGPSKKPEIDVSKTSKPEIDNPSRPVVDKTKTNPSDVDTSKPVKTEVTNSRPAEVDSPNSRPKDVDVTKKPEIENSRPSEVNPTKVKPEMETKVKPDIDAAAASASAVPHVKAQEPDLPKVEQVDVTPDAGKKVQKPEEGSSLTSRQVVEKTLQDQDMSVDEFNKLKVTHIDDMTDEQLKIMKQIRDSIPNPESDTLMQKVIPSSDLDKYLNGDYNQLGGYVAKYDDVSHIWQYGNVRESMRLDYEYFDGNGNLIRPFPKDGDTYGRIVFEASEPSSLEIPYGKRMGGTSTDAPPATQNGFLSSRNGQIIPEWKYNNRIDIPDGSKLYVRMGDEEVLFGIAKDGVFKPV